MTMRDPNHPGTETTEAMNSTRIRTCTGTGIRMTAIVAALAVGVAGCDTTVTNPGRYEDQFLDLPSAHPAIVNGAARSLSDGLNDVAYTTAAISRELFPGGSTSSFGITPRQQQGLLVFDDEHVEWTSNHRARFIAEQGFARFQVEREAAGEPFESYEPAGRAALWAGYANRILGENWCEVTFEAGPPVPGDSALSRAEGWFTRALEIGQAGGQAEVVNAALAGRASVRASLGDWPGAAADAALVPTDFKFVVQYAPDATNQYNAIFWAGASTPYRAHTVWRTKYDQYYTDTHDPRVPWALHPTQAEGDAAVLDMGKVPFHQQQKYTMRESPINLSTGREMRLIEAEAKLQAGDFNGAIALINDLRTSVGVAAVSAANITDAWTLLKRERGIELWLEGRRLGDLRRWQENGTPGALDPLEMPGEASRLLENRSLCYEIPKSERESNPNLR
ncbi:MAG: RagB/SusD family nutrient uptake outer membrane protein [Gemmatimonadaceae bacterium]